MQIQSKIIEKEIEINSLAYSKALFLKFKYFKNLINSYSTLIHRSRRFWVKKVRGWFVQRNTFERGLLGFGAPQSKKSSAGVVRPTNEFDGGVEKWVSRTFVI